MTNTTNTTNTTNNVNAININACFADIKACYKVLEKAQKELAKARILHDDANKIWWNDEARKANYEKVNAMYKTSNENIKLYTMVKNACCDNIIRLACNALISDMKNNCDIWLKYPLHYKKFNELVNDFFKDFMHTYENGNTTNFKIIVDGARVSLINYRLEHNYNEKQIVYRDRDKNYVLNEKLTMQDIEKLNFFDTIAPDAIIKTCKQAIKDSKKMENEYKKMYAKISEMKSAFNNNSAIYYSLPSMDICMKNNNRY